MKRPFDAGDAYSSPSAQATGWYPAWHQSLLRSIEAHREQNGARIVQLATMGEAAANQTVVFRGFLPDTSSLMFATDCRSDKVRQVVNHPEGAICWYFSQSREQYRIAGLLCSVDGKSREQRLTAARIGLWADLSESVKAQFYWPSPGKIRSETLEKAPPTVHPPSSFCLLILEPKRVDCLHLGFTPHLRVIHEQQSDAKWSAREVNPCGTHNYRRLSQPAFTPAGRRAGPLFVKCCHMLHLPRLTVHLAPRSTALPKSRGESYLTRLEEL